MWLGEGGWNAECELELIRHLNERVDSTREENAYRVLATGKERLTFTTTNEDIDIGSCVIGQGR